MPATTVGINEGSYQRLLQLVEQTGRPAGAILEQALADFERKVCAGGAGPGNGQPQPAAAAEAELLEDAGRIHMPPRANRLVAAHVVPIPRRAPRLGADAEG